MMLSPRSPLRLSPTMPSLDRRSIPPARCAALAAIAFGAMTSMIVRSRKTRFPYVSLAFVYGMGSTYHSGKSSDWAEVQTFSPTEAE